MPNRSIIFVLGAGRSGTSALARVLSLCGCTLPTSLLGATDLNPTGFWEPVEATRLNVEFLHRHGVGGDPSMRLLELDISNMEKEEYIQQIRLFISACPKGPTLVIKDGRINELMPFWSEASRREGLSPMAVISIRHPQEVFESSQAAAHLFRSQHASDETETISAELFNADWIKANLLADQHTRHLPRVVVEYSNLLRDWRHEVGRISSSLSVTLPANEPAVDAFLTRDLHHKKNARAIHEIFGYSWTTRVYAVLSAAAQDAPVDFPTLDEIFHAYRVNARAFRIAIHDAKSFTSTKLRHYINQQPIWEYGKDF